MKRIRYFAIAVVGLLIVFLVTGCDWSNPTRQDTLSGTADQNDKRIEGREVETSDSSREANTTEWPDIAIPAFLENRLDYGTYEHPVRLLDTDNNGFIEFTDQGTLDIPEASVLSILTHRNGELFPELYDPDNEPIKKMFSCLEGASVSVIPDAQNIQSEQDTMVEAILLLSNGKYALLHFRSYSDDYIRVEVVQESGLVEGSQFGGVVYGGFSEALHQALREIMGIKEGSLDIIRKATSIRYLTIDSRGYQKSDAKEKEWLTLSPEKITKLADILGKAVVERNYAYGCSYNSILIEADGVIYRGAYTTDSCGMIIIEDKTYKIPDELAGQYESIFVEEVFTDGWEDWLKK